MNQTIIVGNVGRDPEMRFTQGGTAVCNFSVATTEKWTDKNSGEKREDTTWFRVTAWRGLGEVCGKFVYKGMKILVVGKVKASAYANNAGEPASSLDLTADNVEFLSWREDSDGGRDDSGPRDYDDFAPPQQDPDDIPF